MASRKEVKTQEEVEDRSRSIAMEKEAAALSVLGTAARANVSPSALPDDPAQHSQAIAAMMRQMAEEQAPSRSQGRGQGK